jgi:hypothetical protein
MTPDVISGLSVVLTVTVAFCILAPILTWVLPDRSTSRAVLAPINGASTPEG